MHSPLLNRTSRERAAGRSTAANTASDTGDPTASNTGSSGGVPRLVHAGTADWTDLGCPLLAAGYDFVFAADVIYHEVGKFNHLPLLLAVIRRLVCGVGATGGAGEGSAALSTPPPPTTTTTTKTTTTTTTTPPPSSGSGSHHPAAAARCVRLLLQFTNRSCDLFEQKYVYETLPKHGLRCQRVDPRLYTDCIPGGAGRAREDSLKDSSASASAPDGTRRENVYCHLVWITDASQPPDPEW